MDSAAGAEIRRNHDRWLPGLRNPSPVCLFFPFDQTSGGFIIYLLVVNRVVFLEAVSFHELHSFISKPLGNVCIISVLM